MGGLSAVDLILLALGALLIGFAKTSIGGVSSISVALFAAVLPARESTGALLPLLIAGDVFALQAYRAHAQWARLLRLFPSVAVGVVGGAVFVSLVDDTVMRRTIGAVLLGLVLLTLWRRRSGSFDQGAANGPTVGPGHGWPAALGYGSLAGFTTMVANAAGAVMSLYLLTARLDKLAFLGTSAWFFFLVNVFKVPFSIGLGLLTLDSLKLNAVLVPAVLVGALIGRVVIRRVNQTLFERLVIVFTTLASIQPVAVSRASQDGAAEIRTPTSPDSFFGHLVAAAVPGREARRLLLTPPCDCRRAQDRCLYMQSQPVR